MIISKSKAKTRGYTCLCKCDYCGKQFTRKAYWAEKVKNQFCNKSCRDKWAVGENSYMYGKHLSEETREKIKQAQLGRQLSEEHILKLSESHKGLDNHQLGRKHTLEAKKKMRDAKLGIYGENHPNWNGGSFISANGYIYKYAPNHPSLRGTRYIFEHRLVMEKHLGRYLKDEEVVHHINGNRTDNRIENLMLFRNSGEHIKYHNDLKRQN
jgi:hypothetical protein